MFSSVLLLYKARPPSMAHVQNLFFEENFAKDLIVTPDKLEVKQRLLVQACQNRTLMDDRRIMEIFFRMSNPLFLRIISKKFRPPSFFT